ERHKPTLFYSVPTNYGQLLAHKREGADFDLSSLRQAVSAGEALPKAIFERFKDRFGVEILDGIGSTEILHIFISNRPGRIRPGPAGYYWYAGRADDMLKVGGIWVSPVEIENTLLEHPAVQEAGVIGRRDADDLEKPMAYVVLAAGQQPSAELARELQDFVRSKIA